MRSNPPLQMNRPALYNRISSDGCNPGRKAEQLKAPSVTGVAVAGLRINDATLAEAQTTFRAASGRLAPVAWTLKGLDAEVVGADSLAGKLQDASEQLGAEFGIIGQALAELAARSTEINAAFTQVDQNLSLQARTAR
jgi:hypothetical protein